MPTRQIIISMGRKNGKTSFAAPILLTHLSGPMAVVNSQIYSTARSRDQAAVVYKLAMQMVQMSPELANWVYIRDSHKTLYDQEKGTVYRALSAEHSTTYGLSPILTFHDELGQVRGPRDELYDAMDSASGAHESPLSMIISTQAPSDGDLLSMLIDDAKTGADPQKKLFFRCAEETDDPFALETWQKANPALGDFLVLENMEKAAEQARRLPSFMSAFQNLRLNMRVAAADVFVSSEVWKLNSREPDRSAFDDFPVYAGLDLSATSDMTALVLICRDADGGIHVLPYFWLPGDGIKERSRKDRVPYDLWASQGLLELTPGPVVDLAFIAKRIVDLHRQFGLRTLAYDRWRVKDLVSHLDREGVATETVAEHEGTKVDGALAMVAFGQGYQSMSPALQDLEAALLKGRMCHGGNPVLTWNAANCAVTMDPAGNRKLDKKRSTGRIDGMVALTMANRMIETAASPAPSSPYERRGILAI